jgi:hypothetical protein
MMRNLLEATRPPGHQSISEFSAAINVVAKWPRWPDGQLWHPLPSNSYFQDCHNSPSARTFNRVPWIRLFAVKPIDNGE